MGLLSVTLGLPFAPVRAVIALGEVIQRQVEQELRSPAAVRRRLEAVEREAEESGLTAEQAAEAQQRVLDSLMGPRPGASRARPRTGRR